MRIGYGADVARIGAAESITGLWSFLHASGFLTDVISELTPAAGVTVDGALIKDQAFRAEGLAAAANAAFVADIVADTVSRIKVRADGQIEWGPGNAARDVVLSRTGANEMTLEDALIIAHANGLITDDIFERTGAHGVNADGALLKDGVFDGSLKAVYNTLVLIASIVGDSENRLELLANGELWWGGGALPLDTNLYRANAATLKTTHSLHIGADLKMLGDMYWFYRTMALGAGDNDDEPTGSDVVQLMTSPGGSNLTGLDGGVDGRVIVLLNISGAAIIVEHDDAGSAAANRVLLPNSADLTIVDYGAVMLWYYGTGARWRVLNIAN